MKSDAEKYQERMAELKSILENTLSKNEYFFINTDDACGDETFDVFIKIADITGGLLQYKNGEIIEIDKRNFIVSITYELKILNEAVNFEYKYKLSNELSVSEISNDLNNLLKVNGYKGENYLFDISQDVGSSGIAFSNFIKELKLYENGVIWRGRSEFENAEGYEYFWLMWNENNSKIIENKVSIKESIEKTNKHEPDIRAKNISNNTKTGSINKPWWKIW